MGSGVSPTTFQEMQGRACLERLEGGDGVGGFCFKDEAAEGDILSSDVRAVTVPWSAVSCMTDTGIIDASCSRPSCCEAEAQAAQAFAVYALLLHLAGEGGGFFHRLTWH